MPQRHLPTVSRPDKLESPLPACMDTALQYMPSTGCQMAAVSSLPPQTAPCVSGALSCVAILQSTGAASELFRAGQIPHQFQGLPESSSGRLCAQALPLALMPWLVPCKQVHYDVWKFYQSTNRVHAKVQENLVVSCACSAHFFCIVKLTACELHQFVSDGKGAALAASLGTLPCV